MDSLKNKDKINNKKINSLDKEKSSGLSLGEMREDIKIQFTYNNTLKNTMIKNKDFSSILDSEQDIDNFLFEDGLKSDDEENIQEQNDIYRISGRKSIGELNNNEVEKEEILNENIPEKLDDIKEVFENLKFEIILLENNIIDYSCK